MLVPKDFQAPFVTNVALAKGTTVQVETVKTVRTRPTIPKLRTTHPVLHKLVHLDKESLPTVAGFLKEVIVKIVELVMNRLWVVANVPTLTTVHQTHARTVEHVQTALHRSVVLVSLDILAIPVKPTLTNVHQIHAKTV